MTLPTFTFFGSSQFSIFVLEELARAGFIPQLIVTTPDKPSGRHLVLTANLVKTYALAHHIPVITELPSPDRAPASDVFIVASYGKIIPAAVINLPKHHTLNVHPSLLPQYRGASPLQSAMLNDTKETGITIIELDEQMDHGPIIATEKIALGTSGSGNASSASPEWPTYEVFEEMMARAGGTLLARTLAPWVNGDIPAVEQNHSLATYTKKIRKEDAEIPLADIIDITANKNASAESCAQAYSIFRKIQAYHSSPVAFFFVNKKRVKITSATFKENKLVIERVIPEGKAEMSFSEFSKNYL